MSRLFTELYIDEDVSALLTNLLRSRGFVVLQLKRPDCWDAAMKNSLGTRQPNEERYSLTIEFTSKRSSRQYYAIGRTRSGVIIAVRRSPYEILQRLLRLLDQLTADEMENQVFHI